MSQKVYDVFMSLAGPDRTRVENLVRAMEKAGLSVFYDQRLPVYRGITAEIESALRNSTTLLAYYSRDYTNRAACQYELTTAFLAGLREGDPIRRIMVINPHRETDHLAPAVLADEKFDRLPFPGDDAETSRVVREIKAKVRTLTGRIGDHPVSGEQTWHARRQPGTPDFTGRYHQIWELHSALVKHRFGLTHYDATGGVCVLTGLPGIGKSALAAAYAWHFEASHRGGVWWVSLDGSSTDPDSLAATFAAELRALLAFRAVPPSASDQEVIVAFADHVANQPEPSLLIVDGIPGELTAEIVHRLAVPSVGARLRTVLITNGAVTDSPAHVLNLGTMSEEDAWDLLQRYRDGSKSEVTALARRLGHHPMALRLAGHRLQIRGSLTGYADLLAEIDRDATAIAPVTALLRHRIGALHADAVQLLRAAVVCSPVAMPAGLVRRLLGNAAAGTAVEELQREHVVTPTPSGWQPHGLVRDTVRDLDPAVDWTAVAAEAADAVLETDGADPAEESLRARHAGHLALRDDLPDPVAVRLHRLALAHFESMGEAILALPHHRALARRFPDDRTTLLAAARCMFDSGAFEEALEVGTRAGDEGRRIVAGSLDALGRISEADPLWTALMAEPGRAPADTEMAYLRSLRLRGRHQEGRRGLAKLIARLASSAGQSFDLVQAAELELARAEMETDGQVAARRRAAAVVAAYTARNLSGHVNAVEANRMLADARLTLALTDLKADPVGWQDAARELERLRDQHADTHGRRSVLTLTLAVAHAEALIALGRPGAARRAVQTVRDDVLDRLGPQHPAALRADMVLGYAAAQFHEYPAARNHNARAWAGLRDTLGPTHPNTLRAEFNLAVAHKMLGESAAARQHFCHVERNTASSVGRGTDLHWQAKIGKGLQLMPSALWRQIAPQPPVDD
ncbi:tetratricopeptide repeat protein [Actinoplanes awajinensis]|uniref:TIR domain-containing protein n=1 Tax=Actinoplanes awajinensis subsp. mycoplanecinus TaxID=135947 RepID=A0A0X3UPP4_9ACTN|nr:TIR domain-containing protein [Actinoplanes awajinensis]KUL34494.1 hypothetical protein ADL15_15540 [Actinoplanes awajinensis subsp. mycoplanecinus]